MLCEMPLQKVGKFKFVEEAEPQTGVLKLEFICSDCEKRFSIPTNNDIIRTRTRPKTYLTNYVLLAFIACGEYYKDYDHVMGNTGDRPLQQEAVDPSYRVDSSRSRKNSQMDC